MKSSASSLLRLSMGLSLRLLLLLGLCLGVGVTVRSAYASTIITVSPCDQSHLVAAINEANKDNAGDTIKFKCGGAADIKLTGTLSLTGNMTIDGSGQHVTLDGQNTVAVISSNSPNLTLNALTIANGKAASGNNNSGAGISNAGTVKITRSTLSGNAASFEGGGLYNTGTVSLIKSTLSGNSAFAGGGIYNNTGGTVSLTNSTLNGNSAQDGGGLFNNSGTVSLASSTLSGNAAHDFGGGLYTTGTLSSSGSIVAENSASQGNDCFGSTTDKGYNLESGTDCGFTGKGSLQNVSNARLALAALANNGGPTQTMALQRGSVAINKVPKVRCPATDQRGEPRPDGGESNCDMGAYESNF